MITAQHEKLNGLFEHQTEINKKVSIYTPNFPLTQQLRRLRLSKLNSHAATAPNINVLIKGLVDSVEKVRITRARTKNLEIWPIATDAQLTYLWERLIDRQEDGIQLNPNYIASSALSAWRNLKRQRVDMSDLKQMELGQLVQFSQWCEEFETLLKQKKLTTLEQEIEFLLSSPSNTKQGHLYLYGFIDKLPKLWIDWLDQQFKQVESIDYVASHIDSDESLNYLYGAQSKEDELKASLCWAETVYQTNPLARIAIIDVHLKDNLKKTKRLAADLLDPAIKTSFAQEPSLTETGLFQTALALLSLNQKQLPLASARQIVQSPCWGGVQPESQTDYGIRLLWDRILCDKKSSTIASADFRAMAETAEKKTSSNSAPGNEPESRLSQLADKLSQAFAREIRQTAEPKTPLAWANLFQKQLSILEIGFPKLAQKDGFIDAQSDKKKQAQQWQGWIDALGEFSTLGAVTGKIRLDEALRLLRNNCTRNSAQLAAPQAGITVLDTIEAVADYSHIWIMGVDNMTWPAAPSPNPLLPVPLQIECNMPRASIDVETEIAKRLLARLKVAAQETVFSYCALDTDGDTELRPSPMLNNDSAPLSALELPLKNEHDKNSSKVKEDQFEWIGCTRAPELSKEKLNVSGGASLLKTMIVSPFDAFSYWRLGAYELGKPQVGLSAADRGNLVHNVLEQVWDDIIDSERLSTLSEQNVLEQCILSAAEQLARYQRYRDWLNQAYVELETTRIGALVANWIEFERSRTAFKKIQSEERLKANVGGLKFDMRLDRLDQLENGDLVLIDYKTGMGLSRNSLLTSSLEDGSDQPPTEPQLPLYAINLETPPSAICFAQVRPEKQQFIGLGKEPFIRGIDQEEDWPELLEKWRQSLEELAKSYIQGDCRTFETKPGFGRTDPLAPLHRFAEFDQLEAARSAWKNASETQVSPDKSGNNSNDPSLSATDPQLGLPL